MEREFTKKGTVAVNKSRHRSERRSTRPTKNSMTHPRTVMLQWIVRYKLDFEPSLGPLWNRTRSQTHSHDSAVHKVRNRHGRWLCFRDYHILVVLVI